MSFRAAKKTGIGMQAAVGAVHGLLGDQAGKLKPQALYLISCITLFCDVPCPLCFAFAAVRSQKALPSRTRHIPLAFQPSQRQKINLTTPSNFGLRRKGASKPISSYDFWRLDTIGPYIGGTTPSQLSGLRCWSLQGSLLPEICSSAPPGAWSLCQV